MNEYDRIRMIMMESWISKRTHRILTRLSTKQIFACKWLVVSSSWVRTPVAPYKALTQLYTGHC